MKEISSNIQIRRSRIFLLMEEVRRLRIEQRLKVRTGPKAEDRAEDEGKDREREIEGANQSGW